MTPSQIVTYDVLVWVNDITRCPERRGNLASDPKFTAGGRKQGKNSATPNKIPGTPTIWGDRNPKTPKVG